MNLSSRRWILGVCLAALVVLALSQPLAAQQTCTCATDQPFGACTVKRASYPDMYPGSAVVVVSGNSKYLYVPDLYSGYTYRFNATRFDVPSAGNPLKFPSPRGSNATTGIALYSSGEEVALYWAIENRIYRTDLEGKGTVDAGAVELAALAGFLRSDPRFAGQPIATGSLGGITYHATRGTFWGVDIVNDVYFEFNLTGKLVLEDGKPRYFLNPLRNPLAGGAYGNTISYAATGGQEYFDIPVGSLADGRPSQVRRVRATDGVAPDESKIGADTGIFYALGTAVGSPKFVTGIAFWGASCGDGQNSEIILDLDAIGGNPRIIEISADDPLAANVADFACAATEPGKVVLTWKKTLPYTSLKITRQLVGQTGSTPVTVFEGASFETDPQTVEDANVPNGAYKYAAAVTAAQPVPDASCNITLGPGAVTAHAAFTIGNVTSVVPFAVTTVGADRVVVVALDTGDATVYDADLVPVVGSPTDGPPVVNGFATGVAYAVIGSGDTVEERLYWLHNSEGRHTLAATDLTFDVLGVPIIVAAPTNLQKGIMLGDISYDPVRRAFWTVDMLNSVIYAFTPEGAVLDAFKSKQFAFPVAGAIIGGGIEVIDSTESSLVLDLTFGPKAGGIVDRIGRYEFSPVSPTTVVREITQVNILNSTGAADIAASAIIATEEEAVGYVTALDTVTVYKVEMPPSVPGKPSLRRGDVNNDNSLNISDPSFLLEYLFRQGTEPACVAAADANDSDSLEITDAVYLFSYLFKGGPAPPAPFATCGPDLVGTLPCEQAFCTNP